MAVDTIVKYDSSVVTTISPAKQKEDKLFADKELLYVQEEAKDPNWFNRFLDWLSDNLFGGASREKRQTIFDVILWVLCLAGLGVIIWLITRTEFVTFLRGKRQQNEFSFTDVEEDIKGIDFDERISKAFEQKNYRLAIRWNYLKQLNALNTANLIAWQSHKTNIDYTKELTDTKFIAGFLDLSRVYDFVWYGEYTVTEKDYFKLIEKFKVFEGQIAAKDV